MKKKRTHGGFTLIELVIVITILAILAAVAIPAFQNLTNQARNAGTQGALGGIRSALAIYRSNRIANNLAAAYPTLVNMNSNLAAQNGMENGIVPDNPWAVPAGMTAAAANDFTSATTAEAAIGTRTIGGTNGWRYAVDNTAGSEQATVYANTNQNGENAF